MTFLTSYSVLNIFRIFTTQSQIEGDNLMDLEYNLVLFMRFLMEKKLCEKVADVHCFFRDEFLQENKKSMPF